MIFFSQKNRPFELGPYPLERLKRNKSILKIEARREQIRKPPLRSIESENTFSQAVSKYLIERPSKTG